jgi:hypothetical protein
MPVEAVPDRASPQLPRARTVFFDAGIVPDVAVEQLWLEFIGCPATTFVVVNRVDCATAHPFNGAVKEMAYGLGSSRYIHHSEHRHSHGPHDGRVSLGILIRALLLLYAEIVGWKPISKTIRRF